MKKILLTLTVFVLAASVASAQSALLKKLGEKAVGAVEKKASEKVENAVSEKLGNIFGTSKTTTTTTTSSATGYAEGLLDSNSGSGIWAPSLEKSSYSFKNYKEAMAARPAWPSSSDIANREAMKKYMEKLEDYRLGVEDLCDEYAKQQSALSTQSYEGASGKQERCETIYNELVEIYERQLSSAANQLTSSLNSAQSILLGGKASSSDNTLHGALWNQKKQIVAAWPRSQECSQVNSLEGKSGKSGRKSQNELIDSWNAQQLQGWITVIKRFDNKDSADAIRVGELDAELEAMGAAVKKSASWASAKAEAVMLNGIVLSYAAMPMQIFDCPLVSNAYED